jgi:hypothetical protein
MQHLQKTRGWGLHSVSQRSNVLTFKCVLYIPDPVAGRVTILAQVTKFQPPLYFHTLLNCPFSIPFVLTFIHVMGGCTPLHSIQCPYSPTFDGIRQCETILALTPIPALLRLLPNVPTFKPSNVQTILGSPAVYPLLILTKRYPVTIPIHLRYHTSPCPPCPPMSN